MNISLNKAQEAELKRLFAGAPQVLTKIMKESINRVAAKTRTRLYNILKLTSGLKRKDYKDQIKIKRATPGDLTAKVSAVGKGIPLIKFAKKGRKTIWRWVTTVPQAAFLYKKVFRKMYGKEAIFAYHYQTKQRRYQKIQLVIYGKTKVIDTDAEAFIATMKSGHEGIFRREGRRIIEEYGPSISQILEKSGIALERVIEDGMSELSSNVAARAERFLKSGRKAG